MSDLNLKRLKSFAQLDFECGYTTVTTPRKDFLTLLAHVEKLEAALQRVRDIHQPFETRDAWRPLLACRSCTDSIEDELVEYPCDTIEALGDTK